MPAGPTQAQRNTLTDESDSGGYQAQRLAQGQGLLKDRKPHVWTPGSGAWAEWLVSIGRGQGPGSRGRRRLWDCLHPNAACFGGQSSTSSWGAPLCHVQPSSPGAETGTAPARGAVRPLLGCQEEAPRGLRGRARSCGGRTLHPGGGGGLCTQPCARGPTYHQEIVEQEDFALVQPKLLGLVRVRNLEEPAVADEAAVRQRQHLCGGAASARTPARMPRRSPRALFHGDHPPGAESRAWGRCPGEPPKRLTRAA